MLEKFKLSDHYGSFVKTGGTYDIRFERILDHSVRDGQGSHRKIQDDANTNKSTITMNNQPIVIERTFKAPADKVWKAITDKDEMKKWYFDIENFKPVVGLEFSFSGGDEKKQYLHLCKITEVIPGKKISYTWRYEDDPATTLVTFEIFPGSDTTTVRLTHEGVERFSKDNPALAKENFINGWTEIVGTNLKKYLEGGK